MINILVRTQSANIQEILFKGHALYDDYGKDIVCAAVSSILITTVNGILRIDSEAIEVTENKKEKKVAIKKHNETIELLIENMVVMLTELQRKYKENIEIKYKEVSK